MTFYNRTPQFRNAIDLKFPTLLVFVSGILLTCFVSDSHAQRRSQRNQRPKIGDIILFENAGRFRGDNYGLVIDADRTGNMQVEIFDEDGEIKSERLMMSRGFVWELVDRFEKKSDLAVRTWKSADGGFEIKARMLQVEDDKVRIEKEDGNSIAVPIKRLRQKDQEYVAKNKEAGGTGSSNPFEVEASEALPREVVDLMDRRNVLLERDSRHQRLLKLFPNLALGDIVEFHDSHFSRSTNYGIVVSLNFPVTVEVVDEYGELEEAHGFNSRGGWFFFDRQFVPIPMTPRKWSSANGKFNVMATLAEVDGEKVIIKKDDGTKVTLKLEQLSSTDQAYAKRVSSRLNISNDKQLVEERKNYGEDLRALLDRRKEILKDASLNFEVAREAAKMKGIRMRTGPVRLAGSSEAPSFPGEAFVLNFPLRMPEHSRIKNVCYAKEGGVVALVASNSFFGKPTLAVVDVETQDVITNIDHDVGPDAEILAISPSGETLLIGSKVVFDRQVELWKFTDRQLRKLGTFAFDSFWAPQAHLFSDTEGVIQSSYGNLAFFDIADRIKPTHQMSVGGFGGSRGYQVAGKDQQAVFILSEDASKLYAIDGKTKSCIGGVNFARSKSQAPFNFAQVTSNGKSVIYVEDSRTSIYSLETGKVVSSHKFKGDVTPFKSQIDRFQYLGSNLVLNADGKIFEIELGLEIGKVDGAFEFDAHYYPDGTRIVADIDRMGRGRGFNTIGSAKRGDKAKHAEAINAMRDAGDYKVMQTEIRVERLPVEDIVEFAQQIDASDIVEFNEGDTVDVIVKIDGERGLKGELIDYAKDVMAGGGIDTERGSDFTLELTYTEGPRQSETFRIVGYGADRIRKESILFKSCRAELKYRGEMIWQRVRSADLNSVGSEEGLNRVIELSKKMSAEDLFDFEFPTYLRVMIPGRRGKFAWE